MRDAMRHRDSAPMTRYSAAMRRRGFLQCIALGSLAAVLPWRDRPGWQIDGESTSPGARLRVDLAADVPVGATLGLTVQHEGRNGTRTTSQHGEFAVSAGQQLELVTQYPYTDLIAGTYAIQLTLRDGRNRVLDRCDAGSYAIRRFRFSA